MTSVDVVYSGIRIRQTKRYTRIYTYERTIETTFVIPYQMQNN